MKFGNKDHAYNFGPKTEITHCPRCLRNKEEAIREQMAIGCCCDDDRCAFIKEIGEAIDKYNETLYCIYCGHSLAYGDVFCTECGCKV